MLKKLVCCLFLSLRSQGLFGNRFNSVYMDELELYCTTNEGMCKVVILPYNMKID